MDGLLSVKTIDNIKVNLHISRDNRNISQPRITMKDLGTLNIYVK